MKILIIILGLILMVGLATAIYISAQVTVTQYQDKSITLTSSEKTSLASMNLSHYTIQDEQNDVVVTRCIYKNDYVVTCFSQAIANNTMSKVISLLDDRELKEIKRIADNKINLDSTSNRRLIGTGNVNVK